MGGISNILYENIHEGTAIDHPKYGSGVVTDKTLCTIFILFKETSRYAYVVFSSPKQKYNPADVKI